MEKCLNNKLLELIIRYKPGTDYMVEIEKDRFIIHVINTQLTTRYGSSLVLSSRTPVTIISVFTFIETDTGEILRKNIELIEKISYLKRIKLKLYLNDCDTDTLIYVNSLFKLLEEFSDLEASILFELAEYLTLITKYADILKKIKHGEISNKEYYDYQGALEKTSHYVYRLLKILGDSGKVEKALDLVHRVNSDNSINVFRQVLEMLTGYSDVEVFSLKESMSGCPSPLISILKEIWLREILNNEAYFTAYEYTKYIISSIIPGECVIVI